MQTSRSPKTYRRETPASQQGELDETVLLNGLRWFAKNSRLDSRRIAQLVGVSSVTLGGWIDGTVQPRKAKLLDIKSFLGSHAPECLLPEKSRH